MCGIIGYAGKKPSLPVLLSGLEALEYRGYDSAGISVQESESVVTVKTRGRLSELNQKLEHMRRVGKYPQGTCGIGHTRWATHGEPSDRNAHPHETALLSLVHNGIIENEAQLGGELESKGYRFLSETDTEKAAKLIDFCYRECGDPIRALFYAMERIRGSYAFGVIFSGIPNKIFALRRDNPLIVARTAEGCYLSSDVTAILPYTKEYYRPADGIVTVLDGTEGQLSFYEAPDKPIRLSPEQANWTAGEASKGGFPHFMLKEIYEEPDAIRRTVQASLACMDSFISASLPSHIHFVACGTAMHSGLIGAGFIEQLALISATVEPASEFRYRDPILGEKDLVVLISQSGETSDTLAALRHAKARGVRTLAVVNVPGSAIAREADSVVCTLAGPEIAVASTKAYSVQCAVLALLAVRLAKLNGHLSEHEEKDLFSLLEEAIPDAVAKTLTLSERIRDAACRLANRKDIFYIGRNTDWMLCREAALKLKEISYLHAEAYAAGELKHGTISLVEEGVPVVALMTASRVAKKTVSGIREVLARGAEVTVFASKRIKEEYALPVREEEVVVLPEVSGIGGLPRAVADLLEIFPCAVAMQLLAYHVSDLMGRDIDKPRNLAKSVTVE